MKALLLLLSILPALVLGLPARAERGHAGQDHNQAQNALSRGEIRPLYAIVAPVEQRSGARLLAVELEQRKGRLVYELKLILPNGRIFEVAVDAATGVVLTGGAEDSD